MGTDGAPRLPRQRNAQFSYKISPFLHATLFYVMSQSWSYPCEADNERYCRQTDISPVVASWAGLLVEAAALNQRRLEPGLRRTMALAI